MSMFSSPEALLLLALLPIAWLLYRAARRKLYGFRLPPFSSEAAGRKASFFQTFSVHTLPAVLIWGTIAFLIVTLANPQGEIHTKEVQEKGNRFSLAFDVSGSMGGDKLGNAKNAAKDLLEKNPTDPFAILPFSKHPMFESGISFTVDRTLIKETIDRMKTKSTTAVGDGILGATWYILADLHAVHGLKERGVRLPEFYEMRNIVQRDEKEKVVRLIGEIKNSFPSREGSLIIAITDASSNTGLSPQKAVSFAARLGIPVYLIGIDAKASSSGLLEKLDESGGGYFLAESTEEIEALYERINSIKPVVIQTVTVTGLKSFRQELALVAFILLALAFLIRYIFLVLE